MQEEGARKRSAEMCTTQREGKARRVTESPSASFGIITSRGLVVRAQEGMRALASNGDPSEIFGGGESRTNDRDLAHLRRLRRRSFILCLKYLFFSSLSWLKVKNRLRESKAFLSE